MTSVGPELCGVAQLACVGHELNGVVAVGHELYGVAVSYHWRG